MTMANEQEPRQLSNSDAKVFPEVGMKTLKASIFLLMMAVLTVAGAAHAAPVLIGSITDGISEPSRVAMDAQGNVYVSDPAAGRVSKYSSKGEKLGSFNVPRPYGIAVRADGAIYVCSVQVPARKNHYVNKSSVLIYSPGFVQTGTLGASSGEFDAPVDIAIDSAGAVYVADTKKGVVKVFDAQGAYQYSIGGGHLRSKWTKGVAINDAANNGAGEVYVVDSVKMTVQGYMVDVPRISVFSKSGTLLRTFGEYGTELGKMMSVSGIAADPDGQLYVADSGNNVVHILNATDGTPVGEGGLYANYGYRATGVAVSKSKVVYVAWESGRVDAFGLQGYVTMTVSPSSLAFEARQYSANPAAQSVTISNGGSGTLNWTASADHEWISLGQPVAAGPAASSTLAVSVDVSTLTPGSYQGTVTVSSEFGELATISVGLTVAQPLMLNISDWSPSFTLKKGNTTASSNVVVSIDGGAGSWSIAPGSLPSWLSVSPMSGGADATTVTFTASAAGLAAQSAPYLASVPVSAAGVIGDGSKFTVSLTVTASTTISVSTNRPDAAFQVTGPVSYSGTGQNWSIEDVPAGDYTVTFGAVAGYKKPYPQTKTLADGSAISFSGIYASYKDLAAKKNIITAKGPAASADALVKLYKNNGEAVAFDLMALETLAGANVAAGDVDGDGIADLIVGAGAGANNPAVVRVYRAFDKAMMLEFVPFGTLNGAGVAAADLNGDGKAELIVSDNAGTIAVFTVVEGRMTATGIELAGTSAAAADTEGDGRPEIVTVTASGLSVWKIDATPAVGAWTAASAGDLAIAASSVAAADTDGDGQDELIAGINGAPGTASTVVISEMNGSRATFSTFDKYGANVAAADLDGDGKAEVIVGAGAKQSASGKMNKRDGDTQPSNSSEEGTVRVYNAAGTLQYVIRAFDNATNGVNLAVGDLGL